MTIATIEESRGAASVIQVERPGKCYGTHEVRQGIDTGEVFALLGPNGAGKTTLVENL